MLFRYFHVRPLLLMMVLAVASLLGVVGYVRMPRNMFPDVERPQVSVITQLPGASTLTVAQKLSRPIEQELYALSGVRDVQATNKNEVSIVRAEFEYRKGLDAALLDVNNALSRIRGKLPADAPASSIYAVGGFTQPVVVFALAPRGGSGLTLAQVRLLAENDIRTALTVQPAIANVEVFGGYEPAVRVEFDPVKLARFRISQAQLQDLVAKLNRDLPLGGAPARDASLTLTIYGERSDIEALRLLPLAPGVTLGDVAELRLAHAERYSAYHGNGKPAIAVAVMRAPGGAVQPAIAEALALLPLLEARYPNIEFTIADTQDELIRTSNSNMVDALRDAIVFTSLVILVFLGNWRAVATALMSIPLVFLSTLAILWLAGRELNIIVMTGIILALGMLVDDAVVVLENIERHLRELGDDPQKAVVEGTREVQFPVLVGTLATAVVIAPLLFVGDLPQQIFQHMIVAVLIAVFTSYFVAVTFIPRVCAFWYRNGLPPRSRFEHWLGRLYDRSLAPGASLYARALRFPFEGSRVRRAIVVIPAFALLAFSFRTVLPLIGRDAFSPMDTGIVKVHVKLSANEPVAAAEARLRPFESRLLKDPRVRRVGVAFGSEPGVLSMGSGQLPGEATFTITYVDRLQRDEASWDIERDLRRELAALPGVMTADAFDAGTSILSTIKAPVDIRLLSEDWRLLADASSRVKAALEAVPGMSSVSVAWDANVAEGDLVLNEAKLRAYGLTPEQVLAQLPLKGMPVSSMSKLPTVAALPVRSYFAEPYRTNPDTLRLLPISLGDGGTVSLGEISDVVRQRGLSLLTSNGNRYSLDVLAYRSTTPVGILADKAMAAVRKALPEGVEAVEMGDNAMSADSSRRMMTGLAIGVVLLFGVLAPAYGSLRLALVSIAILPLSAIGAVWGLLAFDKALALPAILGIILLFSIVIKNSILMADFIQERRKEGGDAFAAARDSIRLRYRPILMTAFGTIAGMVPIAMERALGLERLSPLADAAIGGLLVGTVLSLFYLPMFYVWLMGRSMHSGVVPA